MVLQKAYNESISHDLRMQELKGIHVKKETLILDVQLKGNLPNWLIIFYFLILKCLYIDISVVKKSYLLCVRARALGHVRVQSKIF